MKTDFYTIAKIIDNVSSDNIHETIHEIVTAIKYGLFSKTEVEKFMKKDRNYFAC